MNPETFSPEAPSSRPALQPVVLCIDDIGMHAGVDEAALDLHALGRVRVVSCMSTGASWREAASAWRERDARSVDVGLHLNLTESFPGAPALGGLGPVILRAYTRSLNRAELRSRLDRQCEAFERLMRRPPSHVDGHQHVHQLPVVRDVVLEVLSRRYGALPTQQRPWLRACTQPATANPPAPGLEGASARDWQASQRKAAIIHRLGAVAFQAQAQSADWATSSGLWGVYSLQDSQRQFPGLMATWLAVARPTDVIMCHPARATDGDALAATRQAEWAYLRGAGFAEGLARLGREVSTGSTRLTPTSPTTTR